MGDEREGERRLEREREIVTTEIIGAEGAIGEAPAGPEADLVIEREEVAGAWSERERVAADRIFSHGARRLCGQRPMRVAQSRTDRQAIDHEIVPSHAW